jgi:hypothetical protein
MRCRNARRGSPAVRREVITLAEVRAAKPVKRRLLPDLYGENSFRME